jgi:serine/threonine protein kinase
VPNFDDTPSLCPADGQPLSLPDPYHLVGRVLIEKYRIDALIGIGGMGAVYNAHHLMINRRVAFKILLPNLALGNEKLLNLFQREAETSGQLMHENIVDVKDAGRSPEGLAYIVMEWLEGHTLEDELRGRRRRRKLRLPNKQATRWR